MFGYEIKFITSDDSLLVNNGDFKTFKYETKKKADESIYDAGKRSYYEKRGGHWRAPRPRQIRQLEALLRDRSIVECVWTTDSLATLIFSSGAIAYLTIKPNTLDVTQVLFDRYCVGKVFGQPITGVVMCKSHLLFTYADRMATLITFGKNAKASPSRIKDRDPHLQNIELGGGSRRAERRVSWCECGGGGGGGGGSGGTALRVLVWAATANEPAPWSPAGEDLANLHLYSIQGTQVSLVAYHQLENETLSAELCCKSDNLIHIVEQAPSQNGVTLTWSRYSIGGRGGTLSRAGRSAAALGAPARAVRRAPAARRLLAACIDASIHVLHEENGLLHSVRLAFTASWVWWCGLGAAALAAGGARLAWLGAGAAAAGTVPAAVDLADYKRDPREMQLLASRDFRGGPILLLSFAGGPLTLLKVTHPDLLMWHSIAGPGGAPAPLLALAARWDAAPAAAHAALHRAARRPPHTPQGEAALQGWLGAALRGPAAPAAAAHDLARKFFHHLLRRGRLEKALSLGVDLSDWDLFCCARWAADQAARPSLRDEAAQLALDAYRGHESECSSSCSDCSSCSGSGSRSGSGSEPSGPSARAPPLPRVAYKPALSHAPAPALTPAWPDTYVLRPEPSSPEPLRRPAADDRLALHFRHLYRTENREPNTLYRYQDSVGFANFDRAPEKPAGRPEKNKVKFSDTVTVTVVPERSRRGPSPSRPLPASLPPSPPRPPRPPHRYRPAPAPAAAPGTTQLQDYDYVEV